MFQSQTLANRALCIFYFPIDTVRGDVHETQGKVRDQRFKAQAFLQFGMEIRFRCYDHIPDLESGKCAPTSERIQRTRALRIT